MCPRGRLPHQVKQRRPDAEFALGVDAHAQRHAVRREKAHALYIHHHAVGILAHELHRVLAVVLGDAHGQRGTDAVILQKHQRPAHAHLLQIAFGDHGGLFGADAGQLGQALGLFVQDIQGFFPKTVDDQLRRGRADAADEAGPQVFFNGAFARGRGDGAGPGVELTAIDLSLIHI